jgi:signal transduction histidine kinase
VSRLPVRIRMTAAFAVAMVVVLGAAALFVYLRVSSDLDENVNSSLETRAAAVAATGQASAGSAGDAEDGFAQVLAANGRVLDAAGGMRTAAISGAELSRVADGRNLHAERTVPGVEGTARLLAVRRGRGTQVVAVGQSLADRDETLSALVAAFALGGPVAVVLASLIGYALAAAGLRPVEAIRRRAADVSLAGNGDALPLPVANDEIRRLALTLNEMLDRLRRSYEREASFVADASHELRTPIAIIKTELEGALRRIDRRYPDADARDALVAAVEECDHLGQLAEDLLVVARTGDGGMPLRPRTLHAAELLAAARERFADRARERDRAVEVDADPDLLLYGDELRLRQALGNLVDNALRYGAGTITLRASGDEQEVRLEIVDEGTGFAPEIAGRAFERFARGDAARTRGGTGLGLAIVRAIADAHGGRAEIVQGTSGATVRIALPAATGVSGGSKRALLASEPLSTHSQ